MAKLTFRERWRLSWELTWPLALLDAAVVVLIHGIIEARGETLDALWAVAEVFVAAPWVVKGALARRYGAWNIVVRRGADEHPRLNYQESFKVMWLLSWRIWPLTIMAALAISAVLLALRIPTKVTDIQDPLANLLGLSVVFSVASLVLSPFLIPGMLRKKYRGFRLELKEFIAPPEPKPLKKVRRRK